MSCGSKGARGFPEFWSFPSQPLSLTINWSNRLSLAKVVNTNKTGWAKPAQTSMLCRQLRQNFVCQRATRNSIHKMKNEYVMYNYNVILPVYFYMHHVQWKYWDWIQNCFVILSPLCQGKGLKKGFLILSNSAGNTTLRRGQQARQWTVI